MSEIAAATAMLVCQIGQPSISWRLLHPELCLYVKVGCRIEGEIASTLAEPVGTALAAFRSMCKWLKPRAEAVPCGPNLGNGTVPSKVEILQPESDFGELPSALALVNALGGERDYCEVEVGPVNCEEVLVLIRRGEVPRIPALVSKQPQDLPLRQRRSRPEGAKGTPFGSRLHAVATNFKTFQALSYERLQGAVADVFGLTIS